jgi:hypothetical protein
MSIFFTSPRWGEVGTQCRVRGISVSERSYPLTPTLSQWDREFAVPSDAFPSKYEIIRFRAKHVLGLTRGWIPVRVKKTRQNNNPELGF